MKDVFSIIRRLTKQLSSSLDEEKKIRELQPIDYILDYYNSPMLAFTDERNGNEYTIQWDSEETRVAGIESVNGLIAEYNWTEEQEYNEYVNSIPEELRDEVLADAGFEYDMDIIEPILLWAINFVTRDKKNLIINDKQLYRMWLKMDSDDFVKGLNKTIFDLCTRQLHEAVDLGGYNEKSIWYSPSNAFLNWFQSKGIDHKSIQPLIKGKRKNRGGRKKGSSKEMVSRIMWIRDKYQILKDKDSGENDKERAELIASEMRKLQSSGKLPEFFKGSVLKDTTVHRYIKTKYWKSITPKE